MRELPWGFYETNMEWHFNESCQTPKQRTDALAAVTTALHKSHHIRAHRNEAYAVVAEWGMPAVALVDRSAAEALGIRAFGVHVNGYVTRADGIHIWTGLRSRTKAVAPGKLDNMVAGGQPAGLSLKENVIKESKEEASLPAHISAQAKPVSMIRYGLSINDGTRLDTLFCYDLELAEDVIPVPGDDECESFSLLHVDEILRILNDTDDFKFNVPLVILDFVIRHGILNPDSAPNYTNLVTSLRQPFPTHTGRH